ncbi:hypothetical protein B0T26DRAFT_653749 [Lasiosphaeria miniovina]|uniref:Cellobiose dehydrogenase-like cytochrome domain-containing protein n=1 Tax=Lasiosphaeria miniovina TaxID=1954250 RepID=A0AA40DN23_9PEZI|nr:uncharacterized protein B0T26DRAFT_653749 [Lasiosphaeria miniovina]KAK0709205.1 hypothetical protein B0T26DRAFT_653749 [Lasiosphaeria miniovina]
MHILRSAAGLAALLGLAPRQFEPDSVQLFDSVTGLNYSSYTNDRHITYRVAIPDPLPGNLEYDTVLQVIAPIDVGWAGLAWGGAMTYNPLAIVWANGTNNVVVASRIAYGYYSPPAYPQANYTVLKTGTHINATHWQVTAKCSGCSKWGDDDIGFTELDPQYQVTFGFAYGNNPVDTPSSIASTFGIHDSIGHPVYDLQVAKNAGFTAKVEGL